MGHLGDTVRSVAFLAFFLSGASSLIFQSIWSRMLTHVFGATGVAISTVVTVFMAGLGLGAYIAGKYADRIKHPVMTYAVVETLVGVWALLVPFLVASDGWLADLNGWLRVSMGAESTGFMIARFVAVVPILIVPTTLMGSSLPLLARHFVRREQAAGQVGSWVGALYSVNTLGAVFGVGLAGFALMPNVGVEVTNLVAVSMNLLLGVGIWSLRGVLLGSDYDKGDKLEWLPSKQAAEEIAAAKSDVTEDAATEEPATEDAEPSDEAGEADATGGEQDPDEAPDDPEDAKAASTPKKAKKKKKGRKGKKKDKASWAERGEKAVKGTFEAPPDDDADDLAMPVPAFARKAAFVAFALSGAAALCYEVVWSRALAMTIGSSVYSFTLILESFLVGIAGGSAVAAAVIGRKRLLPAIALASSSLVILANAVWAIHKDVTTWALLSFVFVLPIAIIAATVVARSRTARVSTTIPALVMLAVPTTAAGLNAVMFAGESNIAGIFGAVVATIAALLACLVALRRYAVLQLALVQLFIAVATFINYLYQDDIPCAFAQLVSSLGGNLHENIPLVQFQMFITVFLCTLPATMGMGAMFPLTLRIWTSGGESVGRDVGTVYAGNTLGSIVGAWLPGFILMPLFGMETTLHIGMVMNLGLALVMLIAAAAEPDVAAPKAGAKAPRVADPPAWYSIIIYILAPLIPALIAVGYFGTMNPDSRFRWSLSQMTLGVFRVSLADDACNPEAWGEPDLVYYRDGMSTTVSVERWGRHYALKNNGKVDASNGDDMPTQIMVAAYPLLMHQDGPDGLDVAVVGFGSGVSVGTSLQFPVRSVDVIELERSIPEASRFFQSVNHLDYNLQEFPFIEMDRLTVINDDGRNYLASTDREYDVIISEPSNPWITGVSDLFTTDHWGLTKQRLREGGIYCQWVQLYELSPENIKTIYRTFASQFDYVQVFAAEDLSSDTVLLGSDSPLPLDLARVERAFALPGVAAELERAYVHSPFDALARSLIASKDEMLRYTQIEYRMRGGEWVAYPDSNNSLGSDCEEGRPPEPSDSEGYWIFIFLGVAGLLVGVGLLLRAGTQGKGGSGPPRKVLAGAALGCLALGVGLPYAAPLAFAPDAIDATCLREPAPLNTDDNMIIEFAAPRDLIGFQRYEGYLTNIYSPDWPYGRLLNTVEGFGEGEVAARNYAELAMALVAHGRKPEAASFIERSREAAEPGTPPRETLVALEVLSLLMYGDSEPPAHIEPPVPGPQLATREARQLMEGFEGVRAAVDLGSYGTALAAMEEIPAPLRLHSGPALRFLYGYLLYKTADAYPSRYRESIDQFEDLVRSDEDYVIRHPEVYYFLARAHDAELNFDKGLRNMRIYVEARVVPRGGAQQLLEPPPGEAPTTDGEPAEGDDADKDEHDGEGEGGAEVSPPEATEPTRTAAEAEATPGEPAEAQE